MSNPYKLWRRYHVATPSDLELMQELFEQDQPRTGAFDTETNGLHIIFSRPFLIQFGWLVPKANFGRVFTFYPTSENMKVFLTLAKKLNYFLGHNVKFDLNMLTNIGYGEEVLKMTNLYDGMAIARLSLEAIPTRDGGDSLALKSLGEKYVHPEATKSESIIKDELNKLNAERIKVLAAALKQFPMDGEVTATGRQKFWEGAIEELLKDPTNDLEDLPPDVRDVWVDWQEEFPEPTYEDVDRTIMIEYGADDIITTLEFFKKAYPTLVERDQLKVLELESQVLLPLYKMERVGLKVDRDYLQECRLRVKAYITKLRNEMYDLCEERVTVGQHQKIIDIYENKWNITLDSADKKAMKELKENFDGKPKRLAEIIIALRSLEKWYSTYIVRILDSSKHDGRAYTQINPYGAVSGRMSSDFQQFPKDSLKDTKGNELFNPRKAILSDGLTAYLD